MNGTYLALVTGHLEGQIGWHFSLKRKVSPKNNFLRYTYYNITNYLPPQSSSNPSPWWLCHHCPLYNTFLCRTLCPRPVAVAGRTVLLLCHMVTPILNTPPICSRPSHVTTAEQSVEIPQYTRIQYPLSLLNIVTLGRNSSHHSAGESNTLKIIYVSCKTEMEMFVSCMRARHSLMSLKKSDWLSLISWRGSPDLHVFLGSSTGEISDWRRRGLRSCARLSSPNVFGRDNEDGSVFVGVPPWVN